MFNFTTLKDIPDFILTNTSKKIFLSYVRKHKWSSFNSKQFVENVYKLSHAFSKAGVKKGTTVAIVSNSSPFWLMVDYAIQDIGAISVPIFANIASENFTFELEDAEVEYIYIASQERYNQIQDHLSSLKLVVTHNVECTNNNSIDFNEFIEIEPQASSNVVDENDIATIIYTSGSTGQPKGVELSHKNIISQLNATQKSYPLKEDDVALSFLPLAHIFERMVMSYYLVSNISIYFADDVKNVGELIKDVKPSVMTVVPRLLDKIYIKMHDNVQNASFTKRIIGSFAFSEADNKKIGSSTIFTSFFDKMVYSKLLEALGGNLRMMISGGAPLSKKSEKFFTNIGLNLYQGYGLTESAPVICANSPQFHKAFTCGKPFDNVQVKIAQDGELLARGDNLMLGYHKQEVQTHETIDSEGWLHTGDLASMDSEGFITINGRKKELFKTSTGKYVSALHVEEVLTQNRWIDYAVVVADNKPYVSALIFLDPLMMESYAKRKHIIYKSIAALFASKAIYDLIKRVITRANSHLNYVEQIKKFEIITQTPSIENHILTPSMKVSRSAAYKKYKDTIISLYGGEL